MFSRTGRTFATVIVALAVVLSMAVGPAMAAQDDGGLLGGDGSDDSTLGGDSGIDVGADGVSVGGDSGVNVSTDGISLAGQDIGTDAVSGGSSPSLPGTEDGPVSTDGSNLEVGGNEGVSVGTDGVSIAGQDTGTQSALDSGYLQGSGSLSDAGALLGSDSLPTDRSGSLPTGPLPLNVDYELYSPGSGMLTVDTARSSPGPDVNLVLISDRDGSTATTYNFFEISNGGRTYIDHDGTAGISRRGLESLEGTVYTLNESRGTYLLALSRDNLQARGTGIARGERVGVFNAQNTPGTQQGTFAGGLFPANIAGFSPSLPVGPSAPEKLGSGITCTGEECRVGTAGLYDRLPENNLTGPIRSAYPFPRTIDQSGTVLPCNKPVTPEDLPTGQLPGLSDLPKGTLPGVPTSLLTNDAVLGLAFGVAPAPCEVSQPLVAPVVSPAAEPGSIDSNLVDTNRGSVDTSNGLNTLRVIQVGPGGNIGSLNSVSALVLEREQQKGFLRLDLDNSEYQYFFLKSVSDRQGGTTASNLQTSLRDGYAGVGGTVERGRQRGVGAGKLRAELFGNNVGVGFTCDSGGCRPTYDGLPKFGDLPTVPNPLAGDTGLPA